MFAKKRSIILSVLLVGCISVTVHAKKPQKDIEDIKWLNEMYKGKTTASRTMSGHAFKAQAIAEMIKSGAITAEQAALVKNDLYMVVQVMRMKGVAATFGMEDEEIVGLQTAFAKSQGGHPSMVLAPLVTRVFDRIIAEKMGLLDAVKHLGLQQTVFVEGFGQLMGRPIRLKDPKVVDEIEKGGLGKVLGDHVRRSLNIPPNVKSGASAHELLEGAAKVDNQGGDHTDSNDWAAVSDMETGKRPWEDLSGDDVSADDSGGSDNETNDSDDGDNEVIDRSAYGPTNEDGADTEDGWTDAESKDDFYGPDGSDEENGELTEEEKAFLDEVDRDNQNNTNGDSESSSSDDGGDDSDDSDGSDDSDDSDDDDDDFDTESSVGYQPSDDSTHGGGWVSVIFVTGPGNDDGLTLYIVGDGGWGTPNTTPTNDSYGNGAIVDTPRRLPVFGGCPLIDVVRARSGTLAPPAGFVPQDGGVTTLSDA